MKAIGMTILLGTSSVAVPTLAWGDVKQGFELHMNVPQTATHKVFTKQPSSRQTVLTTQFVLANARFAEVGAISTDGCAVDTTVSPSGKTLTLSYRGKVSNQNNLYVLDYAACNAKVNVVVNGKTVDNRVNGVVRHSAKIVTNAIVTSTDRIDIDETQQTQAFTYAMSE